MLINCPSCKVKFLVNSADLGSDGRNVVCGKCKFQWFQKTDFIYQDKIENNRKKISQDFGDYNKSLPSTYVEVQKASLLNSLLMILFVLFIITIYFMVKNLDEGIVYLIVYYIQEFISYTNKLIKDLAQEIYKIINQ